MVILITFPKNWPLQQNQCFYRGVQDMQANHITKFLKKRNVNHKIIKELNTGTQDISIHNFANRCWFFYIFIAFVWEASCSLVGGSFMLLDKCLIDQVFWFLMHPMMIPNFHFFPSRWSQTSPSSDLKGLYKWTFSSTF